MQSNQFLLLKKFKNIESAQLWTVQLYRFGINGLKYKT